MQVYSQRTRQSMSLINGSIQNGEWVRLPKHSVKAGKRKKNTVKSAVFYTLFTYYQMVIFSISFDQS